MIFFQTCPDIFITKLKISYAFIQDKIEKNILTGYSLNVPNFFNQVRKKNLFDRINYRTVIAFRI